MSAPTAASPGSPTPDPGTVPEPARPLGRPFAAQLTSTGAANLGDGIFGALLPLIAVGLTTSPAQISLLSAAAWLPWLLLGIAAGVLVDRTDRRRVQVLALLVRAALLGTAALLAAQGLLTMPLLLAVALVYGATEVLADLGATSILPDLVPADRLPTANGRVIAVQQVTNGFLGAPLAAALLVVGAAWGLGTAGALAALGALVLLVGLRGSYRHAHEKVPDGAASPAPTATSRMAAAGAEVREGLVFLWRHPVLRPLTINAAVLNAASTGYMAVFVLWAVGLSSHLGLTPTQFPFVMLGFAVGAVGGSFLAQRVQDSLGEIRTIVLTLTVNSLLLLLPIVLTGLPALLMCFAVIGALNAIGNVVSQSLRQRIVPRSLLGRVGGAGRTLAFGMMPIGAVLGGLVAELWGLPATFLTAVALSLLAIAHVAWRVRPSTVRDALAMERAA